MSNHLISTTYKRDLKTGTRKAVMALMADKASDDGRGVWASKQTMADELCLTRRAIINTIQGLIDDGLLIVIGEHKCATGHTVEYAIHVAALEALPLVGCWQRKAGVAARCEPASPVNDIHPCIPFTPRGEPGSPKPPLEPYPLSTDKSVDPPPEQNGDRDPMPIKPHALPDDWEPPAVDDLQPEARGLVRQWPAGAYPVMCANFRNHWSDAGAKNRRKSDWGRALANWLIRVHSEVKRAEKAGVSFAAAVPDPAGGTPVAAILPVKAKQLECPRSAAIHRMLRDTIGERSHAHWIAPCALVFTRDHELDVIGASDFMTAWVRQNYGVAINAAGLAVCPALRGVRFSVEKTADTYSTERQDYGQGSAQAGQGLAARTGGPDPSCDRAGRYSRRPARAVRP